MTGLDPLRMLILLGWLVFIDFIPAVYAQDASLGSSVRRNEYFTQQPSHTPALIRLDAFETEFESRVFDPENRQLKASSLPAQRLGAVYQLIEAVDKPRQLRVEVTLGRSTDRSKFDMKVTLFEPGGPDKSVLIQAYRLLSSGLELGPSNTIDAWTMKVVNLKQAANIFDRLGMQEMQLWSEFYANHYLLVVLNDPLTAAEGAREIYAAAKRSGLNELTLAALQLEGSAIAAQFVASGTHVANPIFNQAQNLFQRAAELAEQLDMQHERARAIFYRGLNFEQANQTDDAFTQFDLAVDVAIACGDTALANQIREHAAELHEALGQDVEAIALMQQIRTETPVEISLAEAEPEDADVKSGDQRADREMITYLYQQGRLLEKTYRHMEAAEILRQALDLNEKSPSQILAGPVALLLGKALYSAGEMSSALDYLKDGINNTPATRYKDSLYESYGILAAIHRNQGDFAAMSAARERQEMFITVSHDRAWYSFEKALDELARSGADSPAVRSLLLQSETEARGGTAIVVQHLAALQLCALGQPVSGGLPACVDEQLQQHLASIVATGVPGVALQARLLWAQFLRRTSQLTRSIKEFDQLIEEMQFFQSRLPGVLGAWYWQNREFVFNAYMELTLQQTTQASANTRHRQVDIKSLAVLDRLTRVTQKQANSKAATTETGDSEDLERLRSLFASRETASTRQEAEALAREILPLLERTRAKMTSPGISSETLSRQLRQLSDDEALLTYYFAATRVFAWVGRNHGLELVEIPWSANQSAGFSRDVEGLRWDSANGSAAGFAAMMEDLGQQLLAPLAKLLPHTIYFVPSGRMEGFPLDALRWQGAFLAERHTVINLLSLDALGATVSQAQPESLQRFFLAGNRQEKAGDFDAPKPPSEELSTIANLFVGPGLHMVQGAALQWDEFQDERFLRAGTVHLAMPGIIDLRDPRQSRMLLSDNTDDFEHEFLLPQDIELMTLSAELVVLSACEFTGTSQSAFANNTRFVAEFLNAGAASVVASLWPVGDSQAAQFMQGFYSRLVSNPNVSEALYATKQSYLNQGKTLDSAAWAAFQLFTR